MPGADLDDRMAAVEARLDALEAKPADVTPPAAPACDGSLEPRVAALEKEVFPPKDAVPAADVSGGTSPDAGTPVPDGVDSQG